MCGIACYISLNNSITKDNLHTTGFIQHPEQNAEKYNYLEGEKIGNKIKPFKRQHLSG